MRILVVEDDEKIASFIVNGLKQNGFVIDKAPDGEEALALCSSVMYDAVILDILLPKLDGLAIHTVVHPTLRTIDPSDRVNTRYF